MARLVVLRSALLSVARRRELASCWRQHKRHQNTAAGLTGNKSEPILESPFLAQTEISELNLTDFIWQDIGQWLSKPVVTCGFSGRSYTYGEARALCRRFANALLGEAGLRRGDVLGLLLPNIPEYVIAIHGAIEAGIVVTLANPLYTPDEIRRQFMNAGVRATVTIPQLLPVMTQVGPTLPNYKCTIVVGEEGPRPAAGTVLSFKQLLSESLPADIPKASPGDVAVLPFSSGTTGLPKGVKLSHRNLVANLQQVGHPDIKLQGPTPVPDEPQMLALSVLPLFHIYGFNGILNTAIQHGMHVVSLPKFTPEDYISCFEKYKPSVLFVVPSLLLFLASHPAVTKEHLSSVEHVISGAAAAPNNLIDKFKAKLDRDVKFRQGYGMTESSPCTLFTSRNMSPSKMGSCGQIVPYTQAKIVDLTTGQSLGPHQSGELLVRGPQVMLGYHNNEEATQETIDSDGWLHTGDVAYYDNDEYFYIVDRTKELIKVKGNQVSLPTKQASKNGLPSDNWGYVINAYCSNRSTTESDSNRSYHGGGKVSPTELENIVLQIPGVADVAVIGIPDTMAGELPRAFIVCRPDCRNLTEAEVQQYVEPKVASYKKLVGGVKFIDVIPRNAAGKVLRHQLKVYGETSPNQ